MDNFGLKRPVRGGLAFSPAHQEAVSALFIAFRGAVYRRALRILGNPAEAEDVTQEAFLRLYVGLLENTGIDNPRAWILRAAYNLAIDRCRARRNVAPLGENEQSDHADQTDVEADMIDQQRHDSLRSLLPGLSPRERRCMELRAEGLRYREISQILGIRISSIQTNLARAVKKLTEKMNA